MIFNLNTLINSLLLNQGVKSFYDWSENTFDINNVRRFSRLVNGGHDGEGGEVSDGAHGGRADPGTAEERARDVEHAQQHHVPVEAAALLTLVH